MSRRACNLVKSVCTCAAGGGCEFCPCDRGPWGSLPRVQVLCQNVCVSVAPQMSFQCHAVQQHVLSRYGVLRTNHEEKVSQQGAVRQRLSWRRGKCLHHAHVRVRMCGKVVWGVWGSQCRPAEVQLPRGRGSAGGEGGAVGRRGEQAGAVGMRVVGVVWCVLRAAHHTAGETPPCVLPARVAVSRRPCCGPVGARRW